MEFWSDIIIERSFKILQELRKKLDFILIGGWAVYFITKAIKSKDIDIIVDFNTLSKIKLEADLKKNEKLKKFELIIENVSVDIYVPYYSQFAIPIEEIMKNTIILENFKIPIPEILLILKQEAEIQREASVKGQKDRVDILSLCLSNRIDWNIYRELVERFNLKIYLERLKKIIRTGKEEFRYLGLKNPREIKRIKERILKEIS